MLASGYWIYEKCFSSNQHPGSRINQITPPQTVYIRARAKKYYIFRSFQYMPCTFMLRKIAGAAFFKSAQSISPVGLVWV